MTIMNPNIQSAAAWLEFGVVVHVVFKLLDNLFSLTIGHLVLESLFVHFFKLKLFFKVLLDLLILLFNSSLKFVIISHAL